MKLAIFVIICTLFTAVLVYFATKLRRAFRYHAATLPTEEPLSPRELPTISVCIPARNETHAMTQCLERVLASDYEKIEIIVFDDSSEDDTSHLIRSFAHSGVRFVPGTALPPGWLGKNHALDILADEASGRYIVFMDVDTFVRPHSLTRLMQYIVTSKLDMLSVIPERNDVWRTSTLFGTLRYFWEILLDRPGRAAASSSLWVIKRATLTETIGGLEAYSNEVQPEVKIATRLGTTYRYLINNDIIGVTFEKKWRSQVETARRLLYPMIGAKWYDGFASIIFLGFLNLPFFTLLTALWMAWTVVHTMAALFLFAFMVVYGLYLSRLWQKNWWLGSLLWPAIVFQELLIFLSSWWGYARHTITWKGRRITDTPHNTDRLVIDS